MYIIRRSDGTTLVELPDLVIDSETTGLNLVGRGAVNYGQPFSENFVHLLESFASSAPPRTPMTGQLWFDTGTKNLKVYDTDKWVPVADGNIDEEKIKDALLNIGGSGSGINADMVDGFHASDFLLSDAIPNNLDELLENIVMRTGANFEGDVVIEDINSNSILRLTNDIFDSRLILNANQFQEKQIIFEADNLPRWDITVHTRESNLHIRYYDDAEVTANDLFVFDRLTQNVGLGGEPDDEHADFHIMKERDVTVRLSNREENLEGILRAANDSIQFGSMNNIPVEILKNNVPIINIDNVSTVNIFTPTYIHNNLRIDGNVDVYEGIFTIRNEMGWLQARSVEEGVKLGTASEHDLILTWNSTPELTISDTMATFEKDVTVKGRDLIMPDTFARILFDTDAHRSITMNDGTGHFNIRSGHGIDHGTPIYATEDLCKIANAVLSDETMIMPNGALISNGIIVGDVHEWYSNAAVMANGVPIYIKGEGLTSTGAVAISIDTDEQDGKVWFRFARQGEDGSPVIWDQEMEMNVNGMWIGGREVALHPVDADTLDGYDSEDFVLETEFPIYVAEAARIGFNPLRALGTSPLTLSSTTHPFTIGLDSQRNVAYDNQQIQGRQGLGQAADLSLNALGGNVNIGNRTSNVNFPGNIVVDGDARVKDDLTVDSTIFNGDIRNSSGIDLNVGGSTLRMRDGTLFYNNIDLLESFSLPDPLRAQELDFSVIMSTLQLVNPSGTPSNVGGIGRVTVLPNLVDLNMSMLYADSGASETVWAIRCNNSFAGDSESYTDGRIGGGAFQAESTYGHTIAGVVRGTAPTSAAGVFGSRQSGSQAMVGMTPSDGGYAFYSFSGGYYDLSGRGYLPFTGCHEGVLDKSEEIEEGDIVIDLEVIATTVNDSISFNTRSKVANDPSALGVFTNRYENWFPPAAFIDHEKTKEARINDPTKTIYSYDIKDYEEDYDLIQINSVGEGGINVCGRGGNIQKGDLITTSTMPGKGQKQSDGIMRNYTVARARESYTFSDPDEVKLIACIYLCG